MNWYILTQVEEKEDEGKDLLERTTEHNKEWDGMEWQNKAKEKDGGEGEGDGDTDWEG